MIAPSKLAASSTDYWMRVNLAVEIHIKQALLDVLHNKHGDTTYVGLATDQKQLYQDMKLFQQTHQKCLGKVLKPNQWNILCPVGSNCVDSNKWDVTLIVVVLINYLKIPPPIGGWNQMIPSQGDTSKSAFILRARQVRNLVKHGSIYDLTNITLFNQLWNKIGNVLTGLGYESNKMTEFNDLQTGTLEFYTRCTVQVLEDRHNQLEVDLENLEKKEDEDYKRLQCQLDNLLVAVEMVKKSTGEKHQELFEKISQLERKLSMHNKFGQRDIRSINLNLENMKMRQEDDEGIPSHTDITVSGFDQTLTGQCNSGVSTTSSQYGGSRFFVPLSSSNQEESFPVTDRLVLEEYLDIEDLLKATIKMLSKKEWSRLGGLMRFTIKQRHLAWWCREDDKLELLKSKNLTVETLKAYLLQMHRRDIIDFVLDQSYVA